MRYSIAATALMAGAVTAVPALQAGGYGGYGASQITDGQVQVPTSVPAYGPETTPAPYVPSTTEESPEVTKYSTQHVTIISCHSTVKNCPASSTVVSTSLVPVVPTYPATTPETTPVYVPSTSEVSTPVVVPTTPVYVPTTPVIVPTTPVVVPTTPVVVPTTPVYVPTTPVVPGMSEAPNSPATYATIVSSLANSPIETTSASPESQCPPTDHLLNGYSDPNGSRCAHRNRPICAHQLPRRNRTHPSGNCSCSSPRRELGRQFALRQHLASGPIPSRQHPALSHWRDRLCNCASAHPNWNRYWLVWSVSHFFP